MRDITPFLNWEMYATTHRTGHRIVFKHGDLRFHDKMIHDSTPLILEELTKTTGSFSNTAQEDKFGSKTFGNGFQSLGATEKRKLGKNTDESGRRLQTSP